MSRRGNPAWCKVTEAGIGKGEVAGKTWQLAEGKVRGER